MVKKTVRIAFDDALDGYILIVPEDFEQPYCSSCLKDIDKDTTFYFCKHTQNFYCYDCMFKIDNLGRLVVKCPVSEKEHTDYCIQRVEKEVVK